MIRDREAWEAFERELARREPVDYERNLRIFEALLEEARALGRWPPDDPLEGIEIHTRFAAAMLAAEEKARKRSGEETPQQTSGNKGQVDARGDQHASSRFIGKLKR